MTLNLAQVNKDLMRIRDERAESIVIRRLAEELSAQTIRLEKSQRFGVLERSLNGKQYKADAVILGDTDLDIQVEDRFNDMNGILFMVIFVNPNRDACTQAEAAMVE
jgi:hypothetical protein